MAIKIAFIGAGSLTFTRGLFRDVLAVPELRDTEFVFTDINPRNLQMATELCRKDIRANKLPATITATPDRRRALAGANYVISCVRIGGLEAFATDIEIPLKYGVDQCVGDTLCAGGIMYGQRNIASILEFCKDIRQVSRPDVLFLNYANPNVMNTWAANHHGKVRTIGLCHGVMGGHHQIAQVIQLLVNGDRKPGAQGFTKVDPKEVDIICAGINHQTWYIRVVYAGKDWTGRLLEGFQKHFEYARTEKVRIDILKRFGYYSTESNGHLSEYVPWYRKRLADIPRWIDMSSWINGETGGYLRESIEGRHWFKTGFKDILKSAGTPIKPETRGHEHGSYIIEGLETGRVYRGHFNVVNNGCIANLPDDAIIEVPGYVDRNGINIPKVGDLPLGCAAVCNVSISVQRLAVEAAVRGDVNLLKQAMMMDPLTGAVCDPEEISQMTDEMLVAQARWLPQYAWAIPAARARLAAVRRKGEYRGTSKSKGAVRLPVRDYKERANFWAVSRKAVILQHYQVSSLQAGGADIRQAKLPAKAIFAKSMKTALTGGNNGFLDIRSQHEGKDGVVYLRTRYTARKGGRGKLLHGPDGPVRIWVNGEGVDCRPNATNPAYPAKYSVAVPWRKGANEIVIALGTNSGNAWGLFVGAVG